MFTKLPLLVFFVLVSGSVETSPILATFHQHDEFYAKDRAYRVSFVLLQEAMKLQSLEADFQEMPWKAALNRLYTGKVNLVFGASYSEERDKWAYFSLPLAPESFLLVTRTDSKVNDRAEINYDSDPIGVDSATIQQSMAMELGFKEIYDVIDQSQLYAMLESKRVDYIMISDASAEYYCSKLGLKGNACMKVIGPPLTHNFNHVIALEEDISSAKWVSSLNIGLKKLVMDGQAKRIFTTHGFTPQEYLSWEKHVSKRF